MRQYITIPTVFSMLMFINTGCGSGQFSNAGSSATLPGAAATKAPATDVHNAQGADAVEEPQSIAIPGEPTILEPIPSETSPSKDRHIKTAKEIEREILERCIASWSNSPFSKADIGNHKTIYASVNVLGKGNVVKDTEVTSAPKLILVDASVSVLSDTKFVLMNPNGWYCLNVGVNVLSKVNVDLQCKANVSEGKVNVNVISKTEDNVSGVGVNVFSQVKLNRKKDAESTAKCE